MMLSSGSEPRIRTWTDTGSKPAALPVRPAPRIELLLMAGRAGFEPANRLMRPIIRFQNGRLRPLGHLPKQVPRKFLARKILKPRTGRRTQYSPFFRHRRRDCTTTKRSARTSVDRVTSLLSTRGSRREPCKLASSHECVRPGGCRAGNADRRSVADGAHRGCETSTCSLRKSRSSPELCGRLGLVPAARIERAWFCFTEAALFPIQPSRQGTWKRYRHLSSPATRRGLFRGNAGRSTSARECHVCRRRAAGPQDSTRRPCRPRFRSFDRRIATAAPSMKDASFRTLPLPSKSNGIGSESRNSNRASHGL